ncbi:QueT transporter family protein [Granulicatella seriolae]|uniref:QueT transporter family protein n=1 Tax=Granulicatella seriolae TaxID=2967226 RepID=A0ABT1WNP0_9LACT|nr:QueT transporter family protein [Granulicatella seriolae]
MKANQTKVLIVNAIIAALYVVITTVFAFMSFGSIQFRIAEMLNHLIVFDKKYFYGIVGGVILANTIFMSTSGLGWYDLVFGLGHTVSSLLIGFVVFRYLKTDTQKMIALAIIFSVMIFLVAIELLIVLELPFWLSYAQTFTGEIVVMLVGIPVMQQLNKVINFKKQMN